MATVLMDHIAYIASLAIILSALKKLNQDPSQNHLVSLNCRPLRVSALFCLLPANKPPISI
jgi:hypothetical protein